MGAGAEVVGEVVNLPIAKITVGKRLRPVDREWAGKLGAVMAAEGQHTPIQVCQLPGKADFLLVAGAHRLAGAMQVGWVNIRGIVVDHRAMERRRREVGENLWRKGLDPIDRAAFVAELADIARATLGIAPEASPQSIAIDARWARAVGRDTTASLAAVYGWTGHVVSAAGISERSVRDAMFLHRALAPDVAEALRGHPLATKASQLHALARLSPDDQRAVADVILAGHAQGVGQAAALVRQIPPPDPASKAWSAFLGGWSRMGQAMRRDALAQLQSIGLPPGVTITIAGVERP